MGGVLPICRRMPPPVAEGNQGVEVGLCRHAREESPDAVSRYRACGISVSALRWTVARRRHWCSRSWRCEGQSRVMLRPGTGEAGGAGRRVGRRLLGSAVALLELSRC